MSDTDTVLTGTSNPALLVSVRSPGEAEDALRGQAGLIDVKEPARGPLGRADEDTILAVIESVAGRRPVSAALGELARTPAPYTGPGLSYAKWGLAGCGHLSGWRQLLTAAAQRLQQVNPTCRLVVAAYADWQRAEAPPPGEVCAFVCRHRWQGLLLDTWGKDGTRLLDWIPRVEVDRICRKCRALGVQVALAGSLEAAQIEALFETRPNWFAVRGAACHGGQRDEAIDADAVQRLVTLLTR